MSIYTFAPAISTSHNHGFVTWESAFTDIELAQLRAYAQKLTFETASTTSTSGEVVTLEGDVRASKVAWIGSTPEATWFYDRMAFVARQLNAKFYNFDLYGFLEDMQYTIYYGEVNGHYTWHIDMSDSAPAARKLSLVLQLSDPSEYEGGDLQVWEGPEPKTVDKKKGMIAAFPSWTLHRVTPVTKGIRHTVVVWVCGPSFK
jgi:PKHD-type hydroxylase